MKQVVLGIYNNPKHEKLMSWVKLIAVTGSAQVVVQGIGFVCGILVLRLLPTNEYAFYTIANTMLGTMTVLADGGITTGTMSLGGKVWNDPKKLGSVLATGMELRKRFSIFSLLITTPFLIYLLVHHDASWITVTLIICSLIPAFITNLTDSMLSVAPRLRQDITSLQKNQISVNVVRLITLTLTLFLFPWTAVAIISGGLPRMWGNYKLKAISNKYADWHQKPDPVIRKEILKVVGRILPTSIYYCISGQISIWIISVFGSTTALAQIGGLGRLTMVFAIFSTLFSTLITPRFARLIPDKRLIIKRFGTIQFLLFFLGAIIVTSVYFFSKQILWVLGNDYVNLSAEVVFVAVGGCIGLISNSTNQLLSARSMIVPPFIFITSTIIVQVVVAFFLPLHKVIGVLAYGIITTFATYIIRIVYLFFSLKFRLKY